jgi:hypothetical protein
MKVIVAIVASLAVCGACGGGSHDATPDSATAPDAGVADAAPDAAPPPLQLAAGGVQLLVTSPIGLAITPANLAADVDVIEIHQEIYGTPWAEFGSNTTLPAAWVTQMTSIAQAAQATGKPIFLSITPFSGGRNSLAPQSVDDNGNVTTTPYGSACYDFSTATDAAKNTLAYTRYVDWMIDEFHPTWLNVAIEINLYFENCGSTTGAIQISNAAYQAAHAHQADLIVFPSIQIEHLYGVSGPCTTSQDECFDTNYQQISGLMRDRFAMSSYPIPLAVGLTGSAADLPSDWFTRGAARGGERALIAETGMDSTAVVIAAGGSGSDCTTEFTETETAEAAYVSRVLGDAAAAHFDLVNWWSDRDLVVDDLMTACPCTFDSTWCAVQNAFRGSGSDAAQAAGELDLKAFGTMGLRDYAGNEKPLYATWAAARATH